MKNKKGQSRKEIEISRMMKKSEGSSEMITGEEAKKKLIEISELLRAVEISKLLLLRDAGIKADVVMDIASCDIVVRIKYLLLDNEALSREKTNLLDVLEKYEQEN